MARGPDTRRYVDLPVVQYSQSSDRKEQIDSYLREHAFGMFARPADFLDEMLTDDRISGVFNSRLSGLMAAPFEVKAAGPRRKERKAAEIIGGTDDTDGCWDELVPPAAQRELLKWGLGIGIGIAEIVWQREARAWTPRVVPWHPRHLRWDWMERRFMLQTQDAGMIPLPRPDEQPRGDGKWIVFCPWGVQYGWMNAVLRPLAYRYMARAWNFRDWARFGEKHGLAILKAMVPSSALARDASGHTQADDFYQGIANIGNEGTVLCPQPENKDQPGFDLQMVEATARTWETFKDWKAALDVDIAVLVLGQNLTTEVQGGSRAAAQVHQFVRLDKAREDARLAGVLRSQLLTWWAQYNLGDAELAPRPEFQVAPPEDEVAESTALLAYGQAANALKQASARVDIDAIFEAAGIPLLDPEDVPDPVAGGPVQDGGGDGEDGANASPGATPGGPGGGGAPPASGKDGPPGASHRGGAVTVTVKAGAFTHGVVKRYSFAGLPIAVENPAGTIRPWKDEGGQIGSTKMVCDYGFIEGYMSGDGEELDCYVGPDEGARDVHVVHQLMAPDFKKHDEDKVMLGFPDAAAAKAMYLAHRGDDERSFGGMSVIPFDTFARKLRRRNPETTTKITASAVPRTTVALTRTVAGRKRAATYTQALEQKARARAAAALRPDVEALMAEVKACTSLEDLRDRVLRRYKGMDPTALAKVVERANVMAHLSGRVSAVEEL